jgi:hypothetical protein
MIDDIAKGFIFFEHIYQFLYLLNTHIVRCFLILSLFAECSESSWFLWCCDVWWCHRHLIFGNETVLPKI